MPHRIARTAAAVTALGVLGVPAAAHAATKTVIAGVPPTAAKSFQKLNADQNAYFPNTITVHVGDKVKFVPAGFHTISLPAKGGKSPALLAPTGVVSGAADAAGNPWWFNGQPSLAFNPALLKSGFGKSFSYNGRKGVESGLPLANRPKPMTIRFTKTGTFTFYCAVHPGMKGKVHVVAAHAKAPSAKADARTVSKEVTAGLKAAKRLAAAKPTPGVVSIGRSAAHGVESYDFLPGAQTVPVGTTLTFKMPVGSTEDHTATTGPGNPMTEPDSYLGKLAASFQSPQIAPEAIYPSEAPGTAGALSATSHGNGFWNTGVLDSSPQTPLPASSTVTFTQAGTYQFYCLIHPFMHATVTVQ